MRTILTAVFLLVILASPLFAHTTTLTNDYRSAHGQARLAHHDELHDYAQTHAERMARERRLFHSTYDDVDHLCFAAIGENVGYHTKAEVRPIYDAFLDSPTHRDVLLDPRWDRQAIGVAYDEDNTVYIAVMFLDGPCAEAT